MSDSQTVACPVDGCAYEGGSMAAVRAHTNAVTQSSNHPPWSDVADMLATVDSQASDGGETSNGGETDTSEEPPEEPAEPAESDPDMVTADEYQSQQQGDRMVTEPDDQDDAAGPPADAAGVDAGAMLEGVPTWYLMIGALVVVVVAYLLVMDGGGGQPTASEPADNQDESDGFDPFETA